jgi:hypothetical protein
MNENTVYIVVDLCSGVQYSGLYKDYSEALVQRVQYDCLYDRKHQIVVFTEEDLYH